MKKSPSLASALIIILASTAVCTVLTIAAALVTGENLFFLASVLFVVSGAAGFWVVRRLQRTIG